MATHRKRSDPGLIRAVNARIALFQFGDGANGFMISSFRSGIFVRVDENKRR